MRWGWIGLQFARYLILCAALFSVTACGLFYGAAYPSMFDYSKEPAWRLEPYDPTRKTFSTPEQKAVVDKFKAEQEAADIADKRICTAIHPVSRDLISHCGRQLQRMRLNKQELADYRVQLRSCIETRAPEYLGAMDATGTYVPSNGKQEFSVTQCQREMQEAREREHLRADMRACVQRHDSSYLDEMNDGGLYKFSNIPARAKPVLECMEAKDWFAQWPPGW